MLQLPFNWSRIVFDKLSIGKTMNFRRIILKVLPFESPMELIEPISFQVLFCSAENFATRLLQFTRFGPCRSRDQSPLQI